MAFEIDTLLDNLRANFSLFVTGPAPTGSKLVLIEPGKDPQTLGEVIASPNVLRPFHPGFDPTNNDRCLYRFDFMDRLIFVSYDDYDKARHPDRKIQADLIRAVLGCLGRVSESESSTGCSPSSTGTPVYQMVFDDSAPGSFSFKRLDGFFTVIAAGFAGDTGMKCSEYRIARDVVHQTASTPDHQTISMSREGRDLLLSDAHKQAKDRSAKSMPADAADRRARVLAQVIRLRKASEQAVFQVQNCPDAAQN